ncbi:MAG: GGDEF domain-containing protein [Candidatus Thiodiazotropha sp.]
MNHNEPLTCPVEQPHCPVIDEVHQLRHENSELKRALRTDLLTDLYNYRQLHEVLESELERTRRTRTPTALIMLDLDHFKKVNDEWGHEIGNQALRLVSRVIRSAIRKMDVACRYGGEEFAIILPGTHLVDAVKVAERIRCELESFPLQTEEETIPVTASLGVELYRAEMQISVEEFIHLADGYLYQAKQNGRNRVAHPELPSSTEVTADERAALFS